MRTKPLPAMSAALMILVSAILAGCTGTDTLGGEDVPESEEKLVGLEANLAVMSFNIRCWSPDDFLDNWEFRKMHVANLINEYSPDLMGTQEVTYTQAIDLGFLLSGAYSWFGPGRDDGESMGERCAIFYKAERFELLEEGTFWLSETPDVPSRSWETACTRICTWGKFKIRETGETIFHFNTHLDHMSAAARENGSALILEKIGDIAGDLPAVLTGDFNANETSKPYAAVSSALLDSREFSATPPEGPRGTFWGFETDRQPEERIDYAFVKPGIKVYSYRAIDNTYFGGRHPSDHLPILVSIGGV